MDLKLLRGTGRPGPCRVPDNYFGEYFSSGFHPTPQNDVWVTGKFSPTDESTLFIGGDTGVVTVVDVTKAATDENKFRHTFHAHRGVVMDIIPVPGEPAKILTFSGNDIRIWTLETPRVRQSPLYTGHDKSVRAASFVPNDPNVFATGGRDGCILTWDTRVGAIRGRNEADSHRRPTKVYKYCHLPRNQQLKPTKRRSGTVRMSTGGGGQSQQSAPSITYMTHLDEHTIVSASENGSSGIRLWDTRRPPVREESRPLAILELPSTKTNSGVSSMCLDRYKSSLFAASTDNCIYEYHPNSGRTQPVRTYVGACIGADFYTQITCSPISDHILCGSGDRRGLVWDVQKYHSYADQPLTGPATTSSTGIRPVLGLGGHMKKVSTVGYSANAMYMMTMDEDDIRVWERAPPSKMSIEEYGRDCIERREAFVSAERLEQPEDEASRVMQSISITPGPRIFLSPTKAGMAPLQKRKEPFESPFTSRASVRLFAGKENVPPGKKQNKVDEERLEEARKEEQEEEERRKKKAVEERRRNPFYFKHPLMHMPNSVYDRYREQRRQKGGEDEEEEEEERQPVEMKKSDRRVLTLEGWARSSAGRLIKQESLPSIEETRVVPSPAPATALAPRTPTSTMTTPKKLPLRVLSGKGPRNLRDYFSANRIADCQ